MLALVMVAVAGASGAMAPVDPQGAPAAPANTPAARPAAEPAPPWPIQLGLRVASVQQGMPLQDRVVLVPDEATFIDEISRWSPAGRWPVLIEDDVFAPMFIRAFAPRQVVRRTERAAPLADREAMARVIDRAVCNAWGGDAARQGPRQAFEAKGHVPPGLAAWAWNDPSMVAAVALAAGRGLVPVQLDGDLGAPGDVMDGGRFASFAGAVTDAFAATGLPFGQMGDALDALVLCRSAAQRVAFDAGRMRVPAANGMPPVQPGEPLSLTDALCRSPDGQRYAVTGCIFGPAPRSAYAAMCSLFLARTGLLAFDSFGDEPQFAAYAMRGLKQPLEAAGFAANEITGQAARLDTWRERLEQGFLADVMFMNTSGNADFFDLGNPGHTPASSRGGPGDVPVLTRPLALHMIHSFSLQSPSDRETLGGRWLDAGVYAYVGSVHEPYLFAFLPPAQALERLTNAVPFAVAARQWDGPFAMSWRVATLGDPLMLCAAPKAIGAPVRVPATPVLPGEIDVVVNCRRLLEAAKQDRDGSATAAAIRELVHSGQDRLAAQLWAMSAKQPWAARVAPVALEPLFRQRDMDAFLAAYGMTAEPTPRHKDMLWQLWGRHLDHVKDPEVLVLFQRAVRPTWPSMDWERLRPALESVIGVPRARAALLKAKDATANPQQRAAMEQLLKS
jgi:hypothetical protein